MSALRSAAVETARFLITLPIDMADALRERVRFGEYASESEAVREGLRALFARDQAVEAWLREEVAAAYDAVAADLMDAAEVNACLGADEDTWAEFSSHWEQLEAVGLL